MTSLLRPVVVVSFCFLFGVLPVTQGVQSYASDVKFPEMASLVSGGYETHVELTYKDLKVTTFLEEFHDIGQKISVLKNEKGTTYFFQERKQGAYINGNTCIVQNGSALMAATAWRWHDEKNQVFGPSVILWKTPQEWVYAGPATVRGIACNKFTGKDQQDDVSLEYFFSASGWLPGSGRNQTVPVRVTAKGVRGKEPTLVDRQYDFTRFQPTLPDRNNFNIPLGRGCKGLSQWKSMPAIEEQMSFVTEDFNEYFRDGKYGSNINTFKVWYDGTDQQMVRVDGTSTNNRVRDYSMIHDFVTGVQYEIYNNGECKMDPITNAFDENDSKSLKSPRDLFGLNKLAPYTYYAGKHNFRGIDCDVWEAVVEVKKPGDYKRSVYTYFFSASDVEETTDGTETGNSLVALLTTIYNNSGVSDFKTQNYFRFNQADFRRFYEFMNVEVCFTAETQKTYFMLYFLSTPSKTELAQKRQAEFEAMALKTVATTIGARPFRFPYFKVYYEPNKISVLGLLVNRPPFIKGFYPKPENSSSTSGKKLFARSANYEEITGDSESCAQKCFESTTLSCRSFMICGEKCSLSEKENFANTSPTGCQIFIRASSPSIYADKKLEDSMKLLQEKAQNSQIVITLDKDNSFTSTDVNFNVSPLQRNDATAVDPVVPPVVDPSNKVYFPLKTLITKGFRAHVEMNQAVDNNTKLTAFIDEYHDFDLMRGRLEMFGSSYYYFADTQELVTITGVKCSVAKFDSTGFFSESIYWGWRGDISVIGPSAILFRETVALPEWRQQKEVRGIECQEFAAQDKKYPGVTITYCFSELEWSGPDGFQRRPIEATVKGTASINKVDTKIDTTYQFTYFRSDVNDQLFMVPRGLGCQGLSIQGRRKIPKIQPQYSFFLEVYRKTKGKGKVYLYKVWYDSLNKITKHMGHINDEPYNLIQDFNTGVTYYTDEFGNCKLGAIKNSQFDKAFGGLVGVLKTPLEFLNLDGNYYYMGQALQRGIYCDVWETIKIKEDFLGSPFEKIVYTFYFGSPEVVSITDGDKSAQVPVAVHISLYALEDTKDPMIVEYNYFRFDEPMGKTFFDVMNVENCFLGQYLKQYFTLNFPSTPVKTQIAKDNQRLFELEVMMAIQNTAIVSPLRVPQIQVYYEPTNILVAGFILERAPISVGFYRPDDKKFPPTLGDRPGVVVKNTDECAEQCLLAEVCAGFTYCTIKRQFSPYNCYLTSNDGQFEWTNLTEKTEYCWILMKSVGSEKINDVTLNIAMPILEKEAIAGNIKVPIKVQDKEDQVFVTDGANVNAKRFSFVDSEKFEPLQTDRQLQTASQTTKELPGGFVSPRECYEQCLKEESMDCASFSFCKNTKTCRITSIYLSKDHDNRDEVELATNCQVFRKEALKFFKESPGKVEETRGPKEAKASSTAECAYACKNSKDVACRGFQFCQKTKNCVLSTGHVLDQETKLVDANPTCSFFSMLYSVEFGNLGREIIYDPDAVKQISESFEECAKTCAEWKTFDCKSFNYCPGNADIEPLCYVNTKNAFDDSVFKNSSETCQHYFKLAMDDKDVKVKRIKDEGVIGVSGGGFAATLIIMLIVGIFLGAGAFLLFSYYKSKKSMGDGVSVRFTRQE